MLNRAQKFPVILAIALLVLALLFSFTGPAAAAPGCGVSADYASIQAAVDDPACSKIDVAAGTYYENVVINRQVTISGARKGHTVVDGTGSGTVFRIEREGIVSLSRLIIQNGYAPPETGSPTGGGILSLGHLEVYNSTVRNNFAGWGGGIASDSVLTISDSTITGNSANYNAGILATAGATLTLQRSTVSDNHTTTINGDGVGGGVAIGPDSTALIEWTTITGNSAVRGGGIATWNATVEILHSSISDNSAIDFGGGLLNMATTSLRHSTLLDNSAGELGGDLYNVAGYTVSLFKSTTGDIYNEEGGTVTIR